MINVFEPSLEKEELLAVADSFNQHWAGRGAKTLQFEREWAKHIGADFDQVISVNCATEGLFQILDLIEPRVARVYQRDVIIPSIHFIGAAQAIRAAGGTPVFCDVDKHTLNPTLEHIQAAYNDKVKAICLLHYGGVARELDTIREWCDQKGLYLIEDAACSPATVYRGKAAGTWGHFGVWSFDAMKIMSTGDGGMIYCENPEHIKQLRKRLYLGMEQESGLSSQSERWWEFGVSGIGRRAIMNDLAAGIGLEQLKKLDSFIRQRKKISRMYRANLRDLPNSHLQLVPTYDLLDSGLPPYFYWIQTPRRDELAKFLRNKLIYTTFRYYPLHRVFKTGDNLPGTDYAADNTLLLPLHCNLSDGDVEMVCEKVREFYAH